MEKEERLEESAGLNKLISDSNKSIEGLRTYLEHGKMSDFLSNEKDFKKLLKSFNSLKRELQLYEQLKEAESFVNLLKESMEFLKELNVKPRWDYDEYGCQVLRLDFEIEWNNSNFKRIFEKQSSSEFSKEEHTCLKTLQKIAYEIEDFISNQDVEHLSKLMCGNEGKKWKVIKFGAEHWLKEIMLPSIYSKWEQVRLRDVCEERHKIKTNKIRL